MSGTHTGGIATRDTNYRKFGRDYYHKLCALGGKVGHTGGFYGNRRLASICGTIGGRMSRRGDNKLTERDRLEIRKAYGELLAIHMKAKRNRAQERVTVFDRKRGLVLSDAA
jgi:uncharacterized protein